MTAIGKRLKASAEQTKPATAEAPAVPAPRAAEAADADLLWSQIVQLSPWPMSELTARFAREMGGVAPDAASEAELDVFLQRLRAGDFKEPAAAAAAPSLDQPPF